MHITLTGNLGSGKSTICKILRDKYGFEVYSTGTVQRQLAQEMNLTTLEMNQLMCSDRKYDTMIDDATARISRENKDKNIVFDSRLAWNFVEQSFKVFLSVSLDVAANRVMNDSRGAVESYENVEEAKELLSKRAMTENERYKQIYNLEYFNFENYDLVLDSTYATPDEIVETLLREAKKYEEAVRQGTYEKKTTIMISPKRFAEESSILEEDRKKLESLVNQLKENGVQVIPTVEQNGIDLCLKSHEDDVKAMVLAGIPYMIVQK